MDITGDDKIIDFAYEKARIENEKFYSDYACKENLEMLQGFKKRDLRKISRLKSNIRICNKGKRKASKAALGFMLAAGLTLGLVGACTYVGVSALAKDNNVSGGFCLAGAAVAAAVSGTFTFAGGYYLKSLKNYSYAINCNGEIIRELEDEVKYTDQEIEICKFYLNADEQE